MEGQIDFFVHETAFTLEKASELRSWIYSVIHTAQFEVDTISFIFCSDDYLLTLNRQHLDHGFYTDILTFPYHASGSRELHSDIYISITRVRENANSMGNTFWDELHRVMIHGVLHLLGFDDQTEARKAEMRMQEELALSLRNF